MLKAAQAYKRLKYHDDPVIAAVSEKITRQNEQLIKKDKSTPATKAQIKKAIDLARQEKKKEKTRYKKVQETA